MTRSTGETVGHQRHTAAVVTVLVIAVALFVTVTVVAARNWTDARDRGDTTQATLDESAAALESTGADLGAALQAQADAQGRTRRLRRLFTPETVDAVVHFQDQTAMSGCDVARASTRDGTELPTGVQVVDYAFATTTDPALDGLPDRWRQMIDPAAVQTEIDRCAADEAAAIEAERQAADAEAAAQAASTPDLTTCDGLLAAVQDPNQPPIPGAIMYLYTECGIDYRG